MTKHINELNVPPNNRESLCQLGWDRHFECGLTSMRPTRGTIARVVSVRRNLFLVSDGQDEHLCSPAGKLLHSSTRGYPVTGDWVLTDESVVIGVIPRKNILSRGEAGSRGTRQEAATRGQIIAANLDTVFIVCGLDRDFNLRRLERYLTLVYNCGLSPVAVLTKADLHDDPEAARREVETIAFGVPVVLTSMTDGRGREELEEHLGFGRTIAMLGSSGAGKSTLANMLYGDDIQATSAVSTAVGKGRHTTTTRELIRMPQGGLLLDNPGIREIAFHEAGSGMENAFADIAEQALMCRFGDCSHQNEPGCAVLRAVESGEISRERLESYRRMRREMDYVSARSHKSADRVEKERWKDIAMLQKEMKRRKR
ncbi:ribosome small subunit-dependent GTPase A [Salidesulfovibrio onnuriiensis]|uniref:ribosome small subunit-dependent GTPase A n=1 Tax=Salidesulfovibrio onnuriiensis TaxID=2583823 RepID=UPI0011CBB1D9|nr:ribosome small subunit-dependent GTPase A [Salidesulfovibrio onnuriiensis]